MINKKRRLGFTIVELVIVIAVIAILAAVLIPTFTNLVKKANMSADMVAVKEMNTILSAEEVSGKPENIVKVQEILKANGINDFTPMDANNVFYWIGTDNRIILWDTKLSKVIYPDEYVKKFENVGNPSIDWNDLNLDYSLIYVEAEENQSLDEALVLAIEQAESGDIIVLPENSNITMALSDIGNKMLMANSIGKSITIDLNNSTLISKDGNSLNVPVSGELVMVNGTLVNTNMLIKEDSVITVAAGAKVELKNINLKTNGTGLFPESNASEVIVMNSNIQACGFGVGTRNTTSDNIHIRLKNTKIAVLDSSLGDGFAGVMINVPGLLEIDNCTIVGDYQGIIVRGSTAIIKNSNVSITEESWIPWGYDGYGDGNWGEGNNVNLAAITIGNRTPGYYQTPSDVTIVNSKFTGINEWHAMFVNANTGEGLGVTINYDSDCVFDGEVEYGNNGNNIVVNGESVAID